MNENIFSKPDFQVRTIMAIILGAQSFRIFLFSFKFFIFQPETSRGGEI